MTPIGSSTPGTAWFLNGLSNLQAQEARTQRQLSTGYQVNDASDSPSQTPALIQLGSNLAAVQAYQTNLGNVQAEASTADQALATSITLLQNAETFAAQGANTTATAATDKTLAIQVRNIQQQLVSIANTTVQGRYIFGGDQDQSAPYRYNAASSTGVDTLTTQVASRVIVNTQGQSVYQGLTAQQIFDPTDTRGAPTVNNAFAQLQNLQAALDANDQQGIATALSGLQSASGYLDQQQAYYGAAEQRITGEQNNTANQITALKIQIGNIRDTDVVQAATDLTQESTNQSAAFGAQAEMSTKTLFDYIA